MNSRWWGPCVWCFLSVLALALPADADAEEYYVADGKKIALTPSPRYHAFETKADALSDFEARIRKMPDLTIEGSGAPLLERRGIVLVKRSPGAAPGEFMKSIRALSTDPAVVSEAPVFSVGGIDQLLLNEFIVQFKKGVTQADVDGLLKRHDAETISINRKIPNRYVITFPKHSARDALLVVNKLNDESIVTFAQPNFVRIMAPTPDQAGQPKPRKDGRIGSLEQWRYMTASCCTAGQPNDTEFWTQWALSSSSTGVDIRALPAWPITVGSNQVVIAIIDLGVDTSHPDLSSKIVGAYDATDEDNNQEPNAWDPHGTACAGIAAAVSDNGEGIAGVAWKAKILPVRIAYSTQSDAAWITTDTQIEDGIRTAVDRGAHVLSNSWGGGGASTPITSAIDYALDNSRVVVFAVGNDSGPVAYPATLASTRPIIAVSATNRQDQFKSAGSSDGQSYWGSNFGPEVTIAAPGIDITTTDISGAGGFSGYDYFWDFNGTSAATPFVAGAAALLLSERPHATPQMVREWLIKGAADLGPTGFDQKFGYGRLDILKSLQVMSLAPADGEVPPGPGL